MNGANPNLLGFLALRAFTLLVGLAFAWMGYRLFVLGLTKQGGDLEIQAGQSFVIKLTRAAPGIFFALLGAAVVVYSVTQVLQFSESPAGAPSSSVTSRRPGPGPATNPAPATPGQPAAPTPEGNGPAVTICDTCAAAQQPAAPGATQICDTCMVSPAANPRTTRVGPASGAAGKLITRPH